MYRREEPRKSSILMPLGSFLSAATKLATQPTGWSGAEIPTGRLASLDVGGFPKSLGRRYGESGVRIEKAGKAGNAQKWHVMGGAPVLPAFRAAPSESGVSEFLELISVH